MDQKQPKDAAGQAAGLEVQAAGLKQHKATSWAATKLRVLRRVHNHSAQSGVQRCEASGIEEYKVQGSAHTVCL